MPNRNSFHEDFTREVKVEGSSDRSFGLVFAVFFALLGGLAFWHDNPRWYWWTGPSAAILLVTLIAPRAFAPFNWLWTRLAIVMFKIISPLTLGAIYFGTLTPMAIFLRARKKDLLHRRYDSQAATYWILRKSSASDPDSMKNQY